MTAQTLTLDTSHLALSPADSPRVVALKREYRRLDEREEALKTVDHPHTHPELASVRRRKQQIAREIFQ